MDPRFDRAHGAMAGLIYGRSLGVDTSGEEGATAASVCQAILELLTVDKSAEPPALRAVTGTLHKGRTGRDAGPAFHKNLPNGGKV